MKTTISGTVGRDRNNKPVNITNIVVEGDKGELANDVADEFGRAREKIESKEDKD